MNMLKKIRKLGVILRDIIMSQYVKIYYRIIKEKQGVKINEEKIIVSLTTIPSRVDNIWITIESIMRQSYKADKIILWLGKDKFKNIHIPNKLLNLERRGLEIRYCDDLICHTKYYYAMKEFKDNIVITVDDDIIYPSNMIEGLIRVHKQEPECIVCHRAHEITFNKYGIIDKYSKWVWESPNTKGPSNLLLQTGVSGVLYPPNSLHEEVLNKEKFMRLCPKADDIWLKVMALKKGTKVVKVLEQSKHFPIISFSQTVALNKYNIEDNGNDIQFELLIKEYNLDVQSI